MCSFDPVLRPRLKASPLSFLSGGFHPHPRPLPSGSGSPCTRHNCPTDNPCAPEPSKIMQIGQCTGSPWELARRVPLATCWLLPACCPAAWPCPQLPLFVAQSNRESCSSSGCASLLGPATCKSYETARTRGSGKPCLVDSKVTFCRCS